MSDVYNHWDCVNMAIADCLTIGLLDNWDYASKLRSKYSQDVIDEIFSILNYLKTIQPNWNNETYKEFLKRSALIIASSYRELTDKSVNILVNRLAYDWK